MFKRIFFEIHLRVKNKLEQDESLQVLIQVLQSENHLMRVNIGTKLLKFTLIFQKDDQISKENVKYISFVTIS